MVHTPYEDLLKEILEEGIESSDRTGTGTKSLFGRSIRYDLNEGFPLLTTKKLFTRGIIEELLWFISGSTDEHILRDKNVHFWKEWAREDGQLGPVYGKQLRNNESVRDMEFLDIDVIPDQKAPTADDLFSKKFDTMEENLIYNAWCIMISRVYHSDGLLNGSLNKNPEFVVDEWLDFDNFKKDFTSIPGWENYLSEPMKFHLDNYTKIYTNKISPETVTFSPTNVLIINKSGGLTHETVVNDYGKIGGSRKTYSQVDQLSNVINSIRYNPHSRRHIISLFNQADVNSMELPPCHGVTIHFYVRDGKLSCLMYQRSADMFLGVPFNIASYSLLTHMIAQQVGLDVGEFVWCGGDCHIYNNHMEQVKEQLSREAREYPRLVIHDADSIFNYTVDSFEFIGYNPHPKITAEVSV